MERMISRRQERDSPERELKRPFSGRAIFPQENGPKDHTKYNANAFDSLTKRDTEILSFIVDNVAAPLDVIAHRFFETNPTNGKKTKNPENAAKRKLDELVHKGILVSGRYSSSSSFEPGGKVYLAGAHLCKKIGAKLREIHEAKMIHHVQTLRTIEHLRAKLLANGDDIISVELERGLDEKYKGHIPDAKVHTKSGCTIAVEYVSVNYDDKLIQEKAQTFSAFDDVFWSANSPATQARVSKICKKECLSLPRS